LIGFAVAACTALPLTACSFGNEWEYRSEVDLTRTTDHVAESGIFVDTKNGRIEVVADPQRTDVLIEAHVRCKGRNQEEADQRLAATTLSITRDVNQQLVVRPVFPDSHRGGDGASFVVKVPDANGVNLDTSNGSVVATNLSGDLVIDTSNGAIKVTDHDGDAHIDTSNGTVTVTNLSGSLWADTSNGRITLNNVGGPVDADTSNGSIKLVLAGDQSGPIKLDTRLDPRHRREWPDLVQLVEPEQGPRHRRRGWSAVASGHLERQHPLQGCGVGSRSARISSTFPTCSSSCWAISSADSPVSACS
jgi:hypothetical protein